MKEVIVREGTCSHVRFRRWIGDCDKAAIVADNILKLFNWRNFYVLERYIKMLEEFITPSYN
jgi:hypothetical protein